MTKTNLEDKLREIIHRRWEIDDEVGLFIEIKALLQQRMDEIEGEIEKLEFILKDIQGYAPDGEIGTLCDQALNIIKSVDKNK